MKQPHVLGTKGYAENAAALIPAWRRLTFADKPRGILELIPVVPCCVLDIGAGIGTDAAALTEMGHRVVAVEPVAEFRESGRILHPSPGIEWIADSLPQLARLAAEPGTFDLLSCRPSGCTWMLPNA